MIQEYLGKVKFFNIEKGYGFIISKEVEDDIFFHIEQIIMEGYILLRKGDKVSFQLIDSEKGNQAINIYKI